MTCLKRFNVSTPIGTLQMVLEHDAIIVCEFDDRTERITRHLAKHHPASEIEDIEAPEHIKSALDTYFISRTNALNRLKVAPTGTAHELKSWNYLCSIPAGTTQTYGDMAKELGSSPRAVGGANGRNAIALLIPCHRVIGADGSLTGYAGGLERKQWLLRHEGAIA